MNHMRQGVDTRWNWALTLISPALTLANPHFLDEVHLSLDAQEIIQAVALLDTPTIFNWLLRTAQFQGISDVSAWSYAQKHEAVDFFAIAAGVAQSPCQKFSSYWAFSDCRYRKSAATCAEPGWMPSCHLPRHPLRNGRLSQGAYSLFLFLRDVCGGDLVGWIDDRLERADTGIGATRTQAMRQSLLEPMVNIHSVSDKVLSMALSSLLLAADPGRERWVATGASFIVIDTLVHAFLHRTGVLRRLEAQHAYGSACYAPGGCSDVIQGLAQRIDARTYNPTFPAAFPRFVQAAIWKFCAQSERNICNGNKIDDRRSCENQFCPTYDHCDRIPLGR